MKAKDIVRSASIPIQGYLPYLSSVLDPFLQQHPIWQGIFYSAIGLFGVYMAYNQEEVNEITKFIEEHPQEFREEIVRSKEFKKGFLLFTEQYLKQRIEEKKKILQDIILGYTLVYNKTNYELERLNDCLVRMTVPTLNFLIFMKKSIIPVLENEINKELDQKQYQESDRSIEWWFNDMMVKKSIWEPISKWVHDTYSPSTERVKDEFKIKKGGEWTHDLRSRAQNRERDISNEIGENIFELVTLGVLRTKSVGGTWGGGGGTDYALTTFGLKFLKQINDVS